MPENTRRRRPTALIAAALCSLPLMGAGVSTAAADTTTTTTTTVNDSKTGTVNGTFAYSGSWAKSTYASKYMTDDHYSSTKGSTYTFRFRGTSVSLYGAKAPHHGQAAVQVDGGAAVTIDQYGATRSDNVQIWTSPTLPAGDHVVKVTVKGTKRTGATGTVVSVDRAVAKTTTTTTTAPAPALAGSPVTVFYESGDGPSLKPYASTTLNGTNPLWHVEPGSEPVNRANGKITKVHSEQFHRMFSTKRLGGPGKTLKISYRARATAIRDRADSSIIEGVKVGMRFPNPLSPYGMDSVKSAYGTGGQSTSPGSYQFVTGLTERGYMELARNGYGADGYKFFSNKRVGYTPGIWKDVVITVAWQSDGSVRVRYWHNADASGAPIYEAVDTNSPFAKASGFLWMRSDDTDWEYDFLKVEEI